MGRTARRGLPATVTAVAIGLMVTIGPALTLPPSAMAQSAPAVPLHPEYPADLLPIPDSMAPRFSRMCVKLDRLHGSEDVRTPELRGYDEAPVQAYHYVGVTTDRGEAEVLAAFRPFLDEVFQEHSTTSQLWGSAGDLIVHLLWMEGQSNITVHLPPEQALEAQAAMPAFPDERSDLPAVDTLRAYETCYGYFDSQGGSLGFLRSHEGAQLTGQELVDQLTARRSGSEGFEAWVSDDGTTASAGWIDGDHQVFITLDSFERINEAVYLPLAAIGEAGQDGPAGTDGPEPDREHDAGGTDAGAVGADTEVEDDVSGEGAAAPTSEVSVEGRGLGGWIAGGILAVAAVAGGMALGRSRRSPGGNPPKEPASLGAAPSPTKADPATEQAPPQARPKPPVTGPTPPAPPAPGPRQEGPPDG